MPGTKEHLTAVAFGLEIQGNTIALFTTVSGLGISIDTIESREQDARGKQSLKQLPGNAHYTPVTCTRGVVADKSLFLWIKDVADGKIEKARKNVSLVTYDEMYTEVHRYNLMAAWPSAFNLGDVSADNSTPLMETLTITYDYFTLV